MNTEFTMFILPQVCVLHSKRGGGEAIGFIGMTQGIGLNSLPFGSGGGGGDLLQHSEY